MSILHRDSYVLDVVRTCYEYLTWR